MKHKHRILALTTALSISVALTACNSTSDQKKTEQSPEEKLKEAQQVIKENGEKGKVAMISSDGQVVIDDANAIRDYLKAVDPIVKKYDKQLSHLQKIESQMKAGRKNKELLDELKGIQTDLQKMIDELALVDIPTSGFNLLDALLMSIDSSIISVENAITFVEIQIEENVTFGQKEWELYEEDFVNPREEKVSAYKKEQEILRESVMLAK